MDLFTRYLYREILELVDLDWLDQSEDGCQFIHMMPRFARTLPGECHAHPSIKVAMVSRTCISSIDNGKELLSMNEILQYMLRSNKSLIDERILPWLPCMDNQEWLNVVDELRGSIVTYPGKVLKATAAWFTMTGLELHGFFWLFPAAKLSACGPVGSNSHHQGEEGVPQAYPLRNPTSSAKLCWWLQVSTFVQCLRQSKPLCPNLHVRRVVSASL